MGLLSGIEPNPDFATGSELSGTALNTILRNAIILDAASRYGRNAFCGVFGEPPENVEPGTDAAGNVDATEVLLWRGGFKFVAGATTLTVVTLTSGVQTGDTLRVRRIRAAGGFVDTTHALANGTQSHAITISGAGYANDEVVLVQLILYTSRDPEPPSGGWLGTFWGNFEVIDAYISPIAPATAWPGVPTFGPISETNLDQLSNAATWLARAIGLRTEPLFQAIVRKTGPYATNIIGDRHLTVRWRGSIVRTAGHPQIRALLRILVLGSYGTETIRLKINDVAVDSYTVPTTPGEYTAVLRYDASAQPAGTLLRLEIQHTRADMAPARPLTDGGKSYISLYRVWSEPAVGAQTFEQELGIRSNRTFGPSGTEFTLLTWLNRLRNNLLDIKARLDANPQIWARQTLYRTRYSFDDKQLELYEQSAVAVSMARIGTALMLRGKGLAIGYGPGKFEEKPSEEIEGYPWENFKTYNAIDADEVETQRVWLDGVPALPPFAPYNVRGVDLFYGGEEFLPEQE